MTRFYLPENRFRIINKGKTIAFFSFVDNEMGLEFHDWKLIDGSKGPFLSPPSGKPYTPKGETKEVWPNLIQAAWDKDAKNNRNPKGVKYVEDLLTVVYDKYQQISGSTAPAPQKKSARGPVPANVPESNGPDESDLPF